MKKSQYKQNRRRKGILLAIIMILFTGVVLTASTYAWFTANRSVTVESIDVNVQATEGLQISTDATEWKAVITNDDITTASWTGVINQLPKGTGVYASPVSTIGQTDTNGLMQMYKGTVATPEGQSDNLLTAVKSTEANGQTGDFVAFDLFFRSTKAQAIYLTSASTVTLKENTSIDGLQNAARVAFINEGGVEYGSTAAAAQAKKEGTLALIWEPNYDTHTAAGVANAHDAYDINTTQSGGSKIGYLGVKAPITTGVPVDSTNTSYFGSVTTQGSPASGIPSSAYIKVTDLVAGITKVRVYMWIEGQDVDCEDHASGGSITYNLQFSIDSKSS